MLQWHKHQRIILQKAQRALSSLSRTSYSTWGLPVPTSRLVYTAILRSLLSYAVGVWFNPLRKPANISSLITFQNKCLRLIGGAFKATPVFLLESELFLLPLHLYFKFRTACFLSSIQNSFLKDYLDNIFSTTSHYASVAVRTVPPDQVRLIGSTGLDSGLVLAERSVKERVGVLRDSACGLL